MNVGQANRAKTHCPAGHPYDAENTARREYACRSYRSCLRCERDKSRRWREEHPGYFRKWWAKNAVDADLKARRAKRARTRGRRTKRALVLHARGLSNRQIAAALKVHERTIGVWLRARGLTANGKTRRAARGGV
jgi:hypothetical protein